MNISSAQQVPLHNGFGASEHGDSRGDSGGPIVTNDEEVEIGDALSAGSASLLPDLEQDSIRFVYLYSRKRRATVGIAAYFRGTQRIF